MVRTLILTLSACVLLSGTALAADLNVGVANMQQAGLQCEANKAAKQKYENLFKTETEGLDAKKKNFEKKIKDFEAGRSKMDQKTFEQRRNALQKEGQTVGEQDMQQQQRINAVLNAVNEELAQLAIDAAAEVAKAKNLDLILAQNSILFADSSLDVTDEVQQAMDNIWKNNGSKMLGAEVEASSKPKAEAKPAPKPAAGAKPKK